MRQPVAALLCSAPFRIRWRRHALPGVVGRPRRLPARPEARDPDAREAPVAHAGGGLRPRHRHPGKPDSPPSPRCRPRRVSSLRSGRPGRRRGGPQPGVGCAGAAASRRLRVAADAPHLVRLRRGRVAPAGERDLGRRSGRGRARGGDERLLVRVDASAARAGTRADGGGRGRRGARGRGGRTRLLALAARLPSRRHRLHPPHRRRPHDGRGGDALGLRDAEPGAALAAPAAAGRRLRRRPGSRGVDVRPPRGRDVERRGERGAGGRRHPSRRRRTIGGWFGPMRWRSRP